MIDCTSIKYIVFAVFILFSSFIRAQDVDIFTLNGGEVTATYATSTLNRLTDNDAVTEYSFTGLPNDIVFKSSKSYLVKSLSLTSSSSSANKDPNDFEFSGSHDGLNWEVLRNTTNLTFTSRNQVRSIPITTLQPYAYFRLKIKAVADAGTACSIGEWRLIGEERKLALSPSDARANPLSYNAVKVSWRDFSDDEDAFEIQRTANGVSFVSLANVPANTTAYIDSTVNANVFYIYRVCSVKDRGKSAYAVSNGVVTPAFPVMTLLTDKRSFTAADQYNSSPVGEGIACAFDDDANTKFLARSSTVWMRIAFNETYKLEQYSVTSANDSPGRDPKNWRLEGSANGTNWTVLDLRENQSFEARFQKRYFQIENPQSFQYYRLNVIKNNGDGGLTQIADWLLFADVPVGTEQIVPNKPTNFQLEDRAYHHVKLSWSDVANETGYRIERSEDGGASFTYTYEIPANNTESYPYSLKPETDYVFRIFAINGDNLSSSASVSIRTRKREFVEKWENYNLWILDQPATFTKVKEIRNTAFYVIDGYSETDINALYYDFYAANWDHVFQSYGEELSDSRLHVLLIPTEDGGGLASIYDYRNSASKYSNMVYIKANKAWFKSRSESGYIYDVMAHELCHIVEGVGGGYSGSMFFPIWGDSKWAEILQFDIFTALNSPRAASWHKSYTEGSSPSGGADYPDATRSSYWYRDFLYPTYDQYGKTAMLKKFWKLQGQYYRMKNGNFQGNSTNPGGRGNLGELIHFWSGAAGVDVKPYAVKAFGWNNQFESWFQQAKIDYPLITYVEAEIDNSYKNICQNGGIIKSNYTISGINNFIDNNLQTYFVINKVNDNPTINLTYSSAQMAKVNKYVITTRDNAIPKSWMLYGSNDENDWTVVDTQLTPVFNANKITVSINDAAIYRYYRFEFEFVASQIKINEIELWGTEHASAPYDLNVKRLTNESVYVDWSSTMDEVAHYELERSRDGVDFTKIAQVNRYEISYFDENLVPGEYFYRVATVNKNSLKETVYSNSTYINTLVNSADELPSSVASFYGVLNNLSKYPQNKIAIYTLAGQKVFEAQYLNNDLLQYLKSKLTRGIYLVKIEIKSEGKTTFYVNGKIIL